MNTSQICPVCYNDTFSCLGRVGEDNVLLCTSCGLVFLGLKEKYNYSHTEWYDWINISEEVGLRYLKYTRWYYLKQLRILSSLSRGRQLLDIGAGIGVFAKVAQESGWTAICTEVNSKAKTFGTQIYGLTYRELDELASESIDAVCIYHVLEHILNLRLFLAKVKDILKNEGVCAIIVPHYEPLNSLIKNLILRFIPGEHNFRGQIYTPQHILGFSVVSLKNALELVGFHTLKIICVSRGNRTYYPWTWDIAGFSVKETIYELINTLGNIFDRGSWIVGYFRK